MLAPIPPSSLDRQAALDRLARATQRYAVRMDAESRQALTRAYKACFSAGLTDAEVQLAAALAVETC